MNPLSISSLNTCKDQILFFPHEGTLAHCMGAIVHHIPLMRSEDIDNSVKCIEFLKKAKHLQNRCGMPPQRLRISSTHLNNLREEWPFIKEQHRLLIHANKIYASKLAIAHISLPTERVYYKITPEFMSPVLQRQLVFLLHQFNAEGCTIYLRWICEEVEEVLQEFKPDKSDEFTLLARLQDFRHEIHSVLLQDLLHGIEKASFNQRDIEDNKKEHLFSLEKMIVAGRQKLLPLLRIQCQLLKQISDLISLDKINDKKLSRLKNIAFLAYTLMADQLNISKTPTLSWGKRLLLLQLIDQHLGVISAMNSREGIGRTNFVFSIRLALASMMKDFDQKDILTLSLHWDQHTETPLGMELRNRVWKNFEAMKLPLRTLKVREGNLNLDFLLFLPPTIQIKNEGKSQQVSLLIYDTASKKPIGFTEEGMRLLQV